MCSSCSRARSSLGGGGKSVGRGVANFGPPLCFKFSPVCVQLVRDVCKYFCELEIGEASWKRDKAIDPAHVLRIVRMPLTFFPTQPSFTRWSTAPWARCRGPAWAPSSRGRTCAQGWGKLWEGLMLRDYTIFCNFHFVSQISFETSQYFVISFSLVVFHLFIISKQISTNSY